ncbi:MAG: prohibitin family protein [Acidobacteriota bacterium]
MRQASTPRRIAAALALAAGLAAAPVAEATNGQAPNPLLATPILWFFYGFVIVAIALLFTRRWWVKPFLHWYRRNALAVTIALLFGVFIFVYLMPYLFYTQTPGQVGVLWLRFLGGTQVNGFVPEGTFIKFPWDEVYKYSVRYQRLDIDADAVTEEGLLVHVTGTLRFRVIDNRVGLLHAQVGPEYVERMISPELGSVLREVVAHTLAEDLYGHERMLVQGKVYHAMRDGIAISYDRDVNDEHKTNAKTSDFVEVEDFLIRSVILPEPVRMAIENKIEQFHRNEEYVYRLAREYNETLRKGIEGEGIALFQSKVSEGISERYLKWKGIDATLELAKSDNAKIVVIGSGEEGGLPLILGGFGGFEGGDRPPSTESL